MTCHFNDSWSCDSAFRHAYLNAFAGWLYFMVLWNVLSVCIYICAWLRRRCGLFCKVDSAVSYASEGANTMRLHSLLVRLGWQPRSEFRLLWCLRSHTVCGSDWNSVNVYPVWYRTLVLAVVKICSTHIVTNHVSCKGKGKSGRSWIWPDLWTQIRPGPELDLRKYT